jgi:hypothetical protein
MVQGLGESNVEVMLGALPLIVECPNPAVASAWQARSET